MAVMQERKLDDEFADRPQRSARLLEIVPQLGDAVEPEQQEAARAALRVPVVDLAVGAWDRGELLATSGHAFGAVVLTGLVTRHLDIGGHPALDLHGPGDLLGVQGLPEALLLAGDSWAATVPTTIGVLDDRFLVAARRWPRLVTGLFGQLQEQRDRLLLQLVIAEQPRVEDRVLTLFWHLADRFGHVTPDGVVISLALTHEAVGRLIGARRPTVTLAMRALADRGAIVRRSDRCWLVCEMPGEVALTAATLGRKAQPVPIAQPE
jgi:CRP/FNR family cyclic AMP-dependent transcriptional regulator